MQRVVLLSVFAVACSTTTVTGGSTTTTDPAAPERPAPAEPGPPAAVDAGDPRCAPQDVSTFEPEWKPPTPRQHVCTDEQLLAITPCALGGGTQEECARFLPGGVPEDLACTKCVATSSTADTWGATIHTADKHILLNTGGCIALTEPARADCGIAANAAEACVHAACNAMCFADPTTNPDDQYNCSNAAALGGCQQYVEKDVFCVGAMNDANSPGAGCRVSFDEGGFRTIARIFCGT